MNVDSFWAYGECPRDIQGGIVAHRRLGLVHRLREGDKRPACEDVINDERSTSYRRSVSYEDTTEDQAPRTDEHHIDIKTNPETCLHNIVQQLGHGLYAYFVICVSCDSTISYAFGLTKNYEYDIDHNVWVHKPKEKQ